jgi:hypothetical protein
MIEAKMNEPSGNPDKLELPEKPSKYKKFKQKRKEKYKNKNEMFQEMADKTCNICIEPLRELCSESPLNINEFYNMNIIKLPCDHYYHHYCIYTWIKKSRTCPTCRKHYDVLNLGDLTHCRLPCRMIIKKSETRAGEQCEHIEYSNNMGFCRKHLIVLDEILLSENYRFSPFINLINRKLLTEIKLERLKEFPENIRGELLARMVRILEDIPNITKNDLLILI